MKLTLDLKRECPCFWLSCVHSAQADRRGAGCLVGDRVHAVYEQTRDKSKAHVELDIPDGPRIKAYCPYGEKPHDDQSILPDNKWSRLTITNARQINFAGYQPRTEGEFADHPWVFANYLLDGMPL